MRWMIVLDLMGTIQVNAQSEQVQMYQQQIAANKVLIELVQKGYGIAKHGLGTVAQFTHGEWTQHAIFFDRLGVVNPLLRNSAMVVESMQRLVQLVKAIGACRRSLDGGVLSTDEVDYILRTLHRMHLAVAQHVEETALLLKDRSVKLQDDGRWRRLLLLQDETRKLFHLLMAMQRDLSLLQAQREQEIKDIKVIRKLTGQ